MEHALFTSNSEFCNFLKKSILYVIALLIILEFADVAFSKYLQNSCSRKYDTWTKIKNRDFQEYDLLIFGPSRAWVQYDPLILDSILGTNSYNFGIDGSCCDRQIFRWNIYKLYGNKKPKYIIQDIDYLSTLSNTISGYERDQFFPYIWEKEFQDNLISNIDRLSFEEKYIPMYRYVHFGILNILKNDHVILTKGYEGQNREWSGDGLESIDNVPFLYSKDYELLFENFVQDVLSSNIKLIFVMSPMYYGLREKATQINMMYSTYYNISQKFNVPILDYTSCEISNDTSYFYNSMHLNKTGAELFSTILAKDLKEGKYVTK